MRKRIFSILQYILFLGGGLFLVWWQLREMTPEEANEFYKAFTYANYWLIIPVVVMSLLSHLSRSMRWKLLMEQLGYKPALKNVFSVTMIGYLANAAVPRLGEILKCTFLSKYEKLKVDKLVGTILIERTFDVLCYFLFIGITILIQIDVVGDYVKEKFSKLGGHHVIPFWAKLLILAAGITLMLLLLKLLFRKYPHSKIILKIKNFFAGIAEGFKTIQNLKKRKLFIAHTLFIWSMYLLQIYIGFQAMEGTSHLSLKAACSVLSLATLAMILTPGGIGSFPLFVMETLIIYNIISPVGKAFGWLIWGVSSGIVIVAGLTSLVIIPFINRKKNEISQGNTGKIFNAHELQQQVKRWRLQNKTIVFTNGVFDILHEGHIASLSEAASFGHILIVGVNADESVKRLKGQNRPVNSEQSRMLLLATLVMTDAIILFKEDTPLNLISSILPDILVKGGDYTVEQIAGAKEVLANGGEVKIVPLLEGFSTTGIIERMKNFHKLNTPFTVSLHTEL